MNFFKYLFVLGFFLSKVIYLCVFILEGGLDNQVCLFMCGVFVHFVYISFDSYLGSLPTYLPTYPTHHPETLPRP